MFTQDVKWRRGSTELPVSRPFSRWTLSWPSHSSPNFLFSTCSFYLRWQQRCPRERRLTALLTPIRYRSLSVWPVALQRQDEPAQERWHDQCVSNANNRRGHDVCRTPPASAQRLLASRALLRVEMDVTHSFCDVNVHSRCQMSAW